MDDQIPAYIIRKRERDKEYSRVNRKRILASPGYKASQRRKYQADPAYFKAISIICRAQKMNRICTCCTREQFIDVYRAAHNLRKLVPVEWEVDHIVAYALGGIHCCKNLAILCRAAHRKKTNEDMKKHRQNGS